MKGLPDGVSFCSAFIQPRDNGLTDFIRVGDDSRQVIPMIRTRALIETASMDPNPHRKLRVLIDRRTANDVDSKTRFRGAVPDLVRLDKRLSGPCRHLGNIRALTYSVTNTDIRVFLRVAHSLPTFVQRLRHRETQVAHRLLRIRHTQKEVLLVVRVPHASICPVQDMGGRAGAAGGSAHARPQRADTEEQEVHSSLLGRADQTCALFRKMSGRPAQDDREAHFIFEKGRHPSRGKNVTPPPLAGVPIQYVLLSLHIQPIQTSIGFEIWSR